MTDGGSTGITLLFLLICYKNMDEVDQFIDHVRRVAPHAQFAVCDNSAKPAVSAHAQALDCTFTSRPDNPGYLDGARAAYEAYIRTHGEPALPQWVALSNTDLFLLSGDPGAQLAMHTASEAAIVAPRITEEGQVEKNPHLLYPRPRRRHYVNHLLTATPILAMGYLAASALRLKTMRLGMRSHHRASQSFTDQMYSPYGALIFFSRAFMTTYGLPSGVPLLAEEFAIAERARQSGTRVYMEPKIHVRHTQHSTTGPAITIRRARMLQRAFKYIYEASSVAA